MKHCDWSCIRSSPGPSTAGQSRPCPSRPCPRSTSLTAPAGDTSATAQSTTRWTGSPPTWTAITRYAPVHLTSKTLLPGHVYCYQSVVSCTLCRVKGAAVFLIQMTWHLTSLHLFMKKIGSSLKIRKAEVHALYRCLAVNKKGQDSRVILFHVTRKNLRFSCFMFHVQQNCQTAEPKDSSV